MRAALGSGRNTVIKYRLKVFLVDPDRMPLIIDRERLCECESIAARHESVGRRVEFWKLVDGKEVEKVATPAAAADCACGGTGVVPSVNPNNLDGYEPCPDCPAGTAAALRASRDTAAIDAANKRMRGAS
jgi:hypothetical protein